MICTFFGHRQMQKEIEPILRSTLIDLIENHSVRQFYVGNHGDFDRMVVRVLNDLYVYHPISYSVVLAYLPKRRDNIVPTINPNTIFPEGIETVPKRFAISYRNKWMIQHADYVVTYVVNPIGSGAAQFKALAERRGKKVIELADS